MLLSKSAIECSAGGHPDPERSEGEGSLSKILRGGCPERYQILPLLRRVRMTGSEGLRMTHWVEPFHPVGEAMQRGIAVLGFIRKVDSVTD